MVSHSLVRLFPTLVFPLFSVLFSSSSSSSILFFSFTFTIHCLLYCVSPLIPCNYETTRVFYTLFVDFLACYGSHHLLAFLYISTPFYCFYCVSCHFYSVILFFFSISTVQVVFYVLFMLSFTCFFNFPPFTIIFCTCLSETVPNSTPKRNEASCYACGCLSQLSSLF